jgi:signal transduction histidine kinase
MIRWRLLLTELQAEFENRERELRTLRTLEAELRSTPLTPKRFYELTATSLLTLCASEGAQVLLRRRNELQVAASIPETAIGLRLPVASCATGLCVETKQSFRSGNVWEDQRVKDRFVNVMGDQLGSKPVSELAMPITLGDEVIGVLNVESPRTDAFDEHHEDVVRLVAEQAALAFTRLQLIDDTRLLGDLYGIARDLLSDRSEVASRTGRDIKLNVALNAAFARLEEYLGRVKHFQILFAQDDRLTIGYSSIGKDIGLTVDRESVTGRAVSQSRTQVVDDVNADPGYRRVLGSEIKSEMAVPILVADQVVGVLNIESDQPEAFDNFSQVIMQKCSRDIALITILLKLIYDIQARRRHREALDLITIIGHQTSNLIHRNNNVVGAIKIWSEEIQQDCAAELAQNEFLSRTVARIRDNAVKALAIPHEMKRRFATVDTVDVNATIERELAVFRGGGPVTIESNLAPELPRIRCQSLGDIVSNLVQNAVNAIDGKGTVRVSTELIEFPGIRDCYVQLRVADTGRGISADELAKVFTFGFGRHGLGFGLAWVKTFVESSGGSIAVDTSTEGSTFTVRLRAESQQVS